jgi:hypothetical protein
MIAENPGTWMFHCHVEDHMEGGMMAVYTIVPSPSRQCPISITAGDFSHPGNLSASVKNIGAKPIVKLNLMSEMFLTPQDVRRPNSPQWSATQPIAPGQEQTLNKAGYTQDSQQKVLGWALFPTSIKFADGSAWTPREEGECFATFWRDEEHPQLLALPPLQQEIAPD